MRICIIANGYPDKRSPQWGCFERDQALALKEMGHDVSLLYFDRRFRTYWRKIGISRFDDNGIHVYGLFLMPLGWLRDNVSYKIHQYVVSFIFDKLYGVYKKELGQPDLIYAHYIYNMSYIAKIKQKYGIPLVGIEHWSKLTKENLSSLAQYWGKIAYSNVDCLLAVSQSLRFHIKRHFGKESTVVYDMLGQEFATAKLLTDKPSCFRFIAIGSLIYRKGFDILISAFAKSNLAEKGCSVIIVGEGDERACLQQQILRLGVSSSVQLVGRKTKKEIINLMRESHVFILSSRAETFGVVCIEALSQGLPNIATICGGPEEFIDESNGVLIPTDDVDAMSMAMIKMYNDSNKYDINTITEGCKQKFAPSVIAQQLTYIFEEVIKK